MHDVFVGCVFIAAQNFNIIRVSVFASLGLTFFEKIMGRIVAGCPFMFLSRRSSPGSMRLSNTPIARISFKNDIFWSHLIPNYSKILLPFSTSLAARDAESHERAKTHNFFLKFCFLTNFVYSEVYRHEAFSTFSFMAKARSFIRSSIGSA